MRIEAKIRLTSLALLLTVGAPSCYLDNRSEGIVLLEPSSVEQAAAATDKDELPTVALVMKTLTNPFFKEMEKGARQAETELGINLVVQTASQETSIEQQIEIVEKLIQESVEAIVIAPGDSVELIPVLKKAQDAGIAIINIDNKLDETRSAEIGLQNVPFISVDNEKGAYLSASFISQHINTPSQVAILEGIRAAQNAEDRKAGAVRAFQENPNVTEVVMETANWKIDEGYEVAKQLFDRRPDIKAVFCANDMMALGTIRYLKESGKDDVLVAGFDALEESRAALAQGDLAVTIDQQAAQQGYLGVSYALQALKGRELPSEILVDVRVVKSPNW